MLHHQVAKSTALTRTKTIRQSKYNKNMNTINHAQVDLPAAGEPLAALFAEELGLLLEVAPEHEAEVLAAYADAGVPATVVGSVAADACVSIAVDGQQQISGL